jgi:leucyl aminopeptidase
VERVSDLDVKVILQDIKKLETEAVIVGFYKDVRPLKGLAGELDWLLCGSLSDLILNSKLNGSLGEVALLASRGKVPATKIFMVGLGPKEGSSPSLLRNVARMAASSAVGAGVMNMAVEYFYSPDAPYDAVVAALREGLSEGARGRALTVSLLAPDAVAYERISRLVKA